MSDRLQCKAIPLPSPDQCNDAITDDLQDHQHIWAVMALIFFRFGIVTAGQVQNDRNLNYLLLNFRLELFKVFGMSDNKSLWHKRKVQSI